MKSGLGQQILDPSGTNDRLTPATVFDALRLAIDAHHEQLDLNGEAYIFHPLRMMLRFSTDDERIVCLLHDVVEDCETSLNDLERLGYSSAVIDAIDRLTIKPGESYSDNLERILPCDLARRVKLADLEDNLSLARMVTRSAEGLVLIKVQMELREKIIAFEDCGT